MRDQGNSDVAGQFDEVSGILLGRLLQNVDTLIEDNRKAEASRKHQYEKMEAVASALLSMENRMKAVEKELITHGPTLAEFVQIKQQIKGAGAVGRGLWLTGGFLIGFVGWFVAMRDHVIQWVLAK